MFSKLIYMIRRVLWRHHWVRPANNNPYRRTCSVCGQRQEFVTWNFDDPYSRGWWEVWNEGDVFKHWR